MPYQDWINRAYKESIHGKLDDSITSALFDLTWWSTGDIILKSLQLDDSKVAKILDISSGWGRVIHAIKTRLPSVNVQGGELAPAQAIAPRSVLEPFDSNTVEIINEDFFKVSLPESYYTHIISTRDIHYISDEEKTLFLNKAYRLLRPGGKVFFAIPNRYSPTRWITYHSPLYSGLELKRAMEEVGYVIRRVGSYNFIPTVRRFSHHSSIRNLELLLRQVAVIRLMGGLWFVYGQKI